MMSEVLPPLPAEASKPPRPKLRRISTESSWQLHDGTLSAGLADARWFVIQVEPGRECQAALEVRKRGYGTYVPPEVKRVRYPTGTLSTSRRAHFCGYCFVRFAPDQVAWHPIEEAFWVIRVVRVGDRPLPMRPGAVEAIRQEVEARIAETLGQRKPPARWKAGQRLRITEGPLMGLEGLFLGGDAERITLLLDMLGGHPVEDIPDAIVALA